MAGWRLTLGLQGALFPGPCTRGLAPGAGSLHPGLCTRSIQLAPPLLSLAASTRPGSIGPAINCMPTSPLFLFSCLCALPLPEALLTFMHQAPNDAASLDPDPLTSHFNFQLLFVPWLAHLLSLLTPSQTVLLWYCSICSSHAVNNSSPCSHTAMSLSHACPQFLCHRLGHSPSFGNPTGTCNGCLF